MAAKITRTFTVYEIVAYMINDANPPEVEEYARVQATDTTMNDRKARVAFRDAGVALPKHSMVKWADGEAVTYGMTVEDFMAYGEIINA